MRSVHESCVTPASVCAACTMRRLVSAVCRGRRRVGGSGRSRGNSLAQYTAENNTAHIGSFPTQPSTSPLSRALTYQSRARWSAVSCGAATSSVPPRATRPRLSAAALEPRLPSEPTRGMQVGKPGAERARARGLLVSCLQLRCESETILNSVCNGQCATVCTMSGWGGWCLVSPRGGGSLQSVTPRLASLCAWVRLN